MKYFDIFKKWHFWAVVILRTLYTTIHFLRIAEKIFVAEIVGYFFANFAIITVFYWAVILVRKIFHFDKDLDNVKNVKNATY